MLLRLKEEEDNFLPPGGFLPLAERYGMLEDLDRWVVRSAIAWCLKRMRSDPGKRLPLYCVNLSEASLKSPDFARYVLNELQISNLPPRTLCFEIDEPDAINQHAHAQRLIAALKPAGCLHTIDSFGSTKVTFSFLKGLPVDFIKIDGNIIQYILRDPASLAKARAINTVWGLTASPAERAGGLLFVLALALGLAGPVLELFDVLGAYEELRRPGLGTLLALAGIAGTLHAQLEMGSSWRVGVDPSERTALRTDGPFRWVRNPIFSWMILTAADLALLVPNAAGLVGLVALVVGIEIQVRLVEEPYLLRTHGEAYAGWAACTGRFVPGVGRLAPR